MRIKEISNQNPSAKYKETYSDKYGRYLIAGKNLSSGEVIFREKPVAVGAATFNENSLCFDCLRVIPKSVTIDIKITCSQCKIAIFCSNTCEANKHHHSPEECKLFQDKLTPTTCNQLCMKDILLPLRLLLIKTQNNELWNKLLKLEAHLDTRRNTAVWNERQEIVIDTLKTLKLIDEQNADDELLQRICGILDVNSLELRSPGSINNSELRGVYVDAALMAHDCRGNTYLTVDDDFQLTIYASQAIDNGEPILFNYTTSLLGTAERRAHLLQGKYFECDCKLCDDPEELGANLSALVCPQCREGFITFVAKQSKKQFYSIEKNWTCNRCHRVYSGRLIKTTLQLAKSRIDDIDGSSAKEYESLFKKLLLTLHSNHFLMLTLKQKLLQLYRHEVSCLNPKKNALCRIVELCHEVLQVLEIVEPGLSRLKGVILYELHLPIVVLANRDYVAREITLDAMIMRLGDAESYLKKSLSMLLLEPATTPEGMLAKRALQDLKELRQNIDDVKSLPASSSVGKSNNRQLRKDKKQINE